jgi:hypothetical protein
MALSRSIRPLRRFAQVDWRRRGLVVEAVVCLLAARLALIFLPFPKLARRLGDFVPPSDPRALRGRAAGDAAQARIAGEVGWAVTRSARYVPFKAVCLPQAMAARVMLQRRGVSSVMHFGAARGEDKPFDAHAWLDAAGVEVTGYPVAKDFAEIACFV